MHIFLQYCQKHGIDYMALYIRWLFIYQQNIAIIKHILANIFI